MTLSEAISKIDELKPNHYTQEQKAKWIEDLDERIKVEIIDTHEGADKVVFKGYDPETDADTELLVPAPYDEVYVFWLESRIDYSNSEIARYNNSISNYNAAYNAYANYYNRHNMPLTQRLRFF